MAGSRDVKFIEQINLLIGNSLEPKTLHQLHPRHGAPHFDQLVVNHMQDLIMQGVIVCKAEVVGGSGSGGCCI